MLSLLAAAQAIIAVAFDPAGGSLAVGSKDGTITLWSLRSGNHTVMRSLPGGGLNALAFSPDGKSLAAAGPSLFIDAQRMGEQDAVYGTVVFSPDGGRLATVNAREQIEIREVPTGRTLLTLCCMALYGELAFSRDGHVLAAAGHRPRLWNLETGQEIRHLVATREPTFGPIAFSPDGLALAAGSQDGRARLWDVTTGRLLLSSPASRDYVESLAFHPAGQRIALKDRSGRILIWNLGRNTLGALATRAASSNLAFSPDGRYLAFATLDGDVFLWDWSADRPVRILARNPGSER